MLKGGREYSSIQEKWLAKYYSKELQALCDIGLCTSSVYDMKYEEIKRLIMQRDTKEIASRLTEKLNEILPLKMRIKNKKEIMGKIFLSAYLIASELSTGDVETVYDTKLSKIALQLINGLNKLREYSLYNSAEGFIIKLKNVSVLWSNFYNYFLIWREVDSVKNIEEMKIYKEQINSLLEATSNCGQSTDTWHKHILEYKKDVDKYEKLFSKSLGAIKIHESSQEYEDVSLAGVSNIQIVHSLLTNEKLKVRGEAGVHLHFLVYECAEALINGDIGSLCVKAYFEMLKKNIESSQELTGQACKTVSSLEHLRKIDNLLNTLEIVPSESIKDNVLSILPTLEWLELIMKNIDLGSLEDISCKYSTCELKAIISECDKELLVSKLGEILMNIIKKSLSQKADAIEFYLKKIRVLLMDKLLLYERDHIDEKIGTRPLKITFCNTYFLIEDVMKKLFDESLPSPKEISDWSIYSTMITTLLFSPIILEKKNIPETLQTDIKSILHLQITAQTIVTVMSIISFVEHKYTLSITSKIKLKDKLISLFCFSSQTSEEENGDQNSNIHSSKISTMESVEHCVLDTIELKSYTETTHFEKNVIGSLRLNLKKIICNDSNVIKLLRERLKDVCLKSLKNMSEHLEQQYYEMKILSKEITELTTEAFSLAKCNFDIYKPYYSKIIGELKYTLGINDVQQ